MQVFVAQKEILNESFEAAFATHVDALACVALQPAYLASITLSRKFVKVFEKEATNWAVPVLRVIYSDNYMLVLQSKAAEAMRDGNRATVQHRGADLASSRKQGALAVMCALIKIYFKMKNLRAASALLQSTTSSVFPPLDIFPLAERVTFAYLTGRLRMFEGAMQEANASLTYAFTQCHKDSKTNLRLIAESLIPVRMRAGQLPTDEFLREFRLDALYGPLIASFRQGNIQAYRAALQRQSAHFLHTGVYLVLEELQILVYRNLFKRTYIAAGQSALYLPLLKRALQLSEGEEVHDDELECILANLLHKGMMRGYLAHGRALVLSKKEAFPALSL